MKIYIVNKNTPFIKNGLVEVFLLCYFWQAETQIYLLKYSQKILVLIWLDTHTFMSSKTFVAFFRTVSPFNILGKRTWFWINKIFILISLLYDLQQSEKMMYLCTVSITWMIGREKCVFSSTSCKLYLIQSLIICV